jgi:MFS family permease
MSEADYALARPIRSFVTHASWARWLALPVLLAGTFMIVLDFFIVNVALPALSGDLRAGATAVEWVLAGFGLTLATFLITAGRLGDRTGRRRLFTLGLALAAFERSLAQIAVLLLVVAAMTRLLPPAR